MTDIATDTRLTRLGGVYKTPTESVSVTTATTPLQSLAAQINDAHDEALASVRTALGHACRAGDLLIEAKRQLGHGAWIPWLRKHCTTVSERTAQKYMQLARELPALTAKAPRAADLSLRGALALLAEEGDVEPAADTEDVPTLGANPTADELLAWIEAMRRRTEAADRALMIDMEAHGNLPKAGHRRGVDGVLRRDQ